MPSAKPRNAFYAQSGGVTAVINASACGVIETARKHKSRIGKVYAGRNGIVGALTEDLIDTSKESAAAIRALRHTPAGAFGSARYKLKKFEDNPRAVRAADRGLQGARHRLFLLQRRRRLGRHLPQGLAARRPARLPDPAIHVPKTVDNDLPITDCCPGFGSVAKYVAVSIREAGFDVASMARDLDQGVRHGGDGPARRLDRRGRRPRRREGRRRAAHHPVSRDRVRRGRVPARASRSASRSTATARSSSRKACSNAEGKFLADAGTARCVRPCAARRRRAGRSRSWCKRKLGYKYHWAVADYLQRAARHIASKVDVEQAYAVGKAAVELALKGQNSVMPTIVRTSQTSRTDGRSARRRSRTSRTRKRCCRATTSPRTAFTSPRRRRRYLAPLIKGEDYPPYKDGLPQYVELEERAGAQEAGRTLCGIVARALFWAAARRDPRRTWTKPALQDRRRRSY